MGADINKWKFSSFEMKAKVTEGESGVQGELS